MIGYDVYLASGQKVGSYEDWSEASRALNRAGGPAVLAKNFVALRFSSWSDRRKQNAMNAMLQEFARGTATPSEPEPRPAPEPTPSEPTPVEPTPPESPAPVPSEASEPSEPSVRPEAPRPIEENTTVNTATQTTKLCRTAGCQNPAGQDGPRVDMRGLCIPCRKTKINREYHEKARAKRRAERAEQVVANSTSGSKRSDRSKASKPASAPKAPSGSKPSRATTGPTPSPARARVRISSGEIVAEFERKEELEALVLQIRGLIQGVLGK